MTRKRREDLILEYLHKHGPLPPIVLYRGLRYRRDVTFAYRTTQALLSDLYQEGYAIRVDPKRLEDGDLVELEDRGRGAYYALDELGVSRVEDG